MPNIVLPPAPMSMLVRQQTRQGLPGHPGGHHRRPAMQVPESIPHHRRAVAATDLPKHRRGVALTGEKSSALNALAWYGEPSAPMSAEAHHFRQQCQRKRAALQSHWLVGQEHMAKLESAFLTVKGSDSFGRLLENETAKWNKSAMAGKILRALAPAMMMRPILQEVGSVLRGSANSAVTSGRVFAEGYYTELALWCDHAIEKKDIGFIFGQAATLLGPVLGPLLAPVVPALVSSGMPTVAAKHVGSAAKTVLKKGLQSALVDSSPQVPGAPAPVRPIVPLPGLSATPVDPMRFTMAWMGYVTNLGSGSMSSAESAAVNIILIEFGGRRSVEMMHEFLYASMV
jgi:hypothetical protein